MFCFYSNDEANKVTRFNFKLMLSEKLYNRSDMTWNPKGKGLFTCLFVCLFTLTQLTCCNLMNSPHLWQCCPASQQLFQVMCANITSCMQACVRQGILRTFKHFYNNCTHKFGTEMRRGNTRGWEYTCSFFPPAGKVYYWYESLLTGQVTSLFVSLEIAAHSSCNNERMDLFRMAESFMLWRVIHQRVS